MKKSENKVEITSFLHHAKAAGVTLRPYNVNGWLGLIAEGKPMNAYLRRAFERHKAEVAAFLWDGQLKADADLATQRAKFVLDQIEARGLSIRFSKRLDGGIDWVISGDIGEEASKLCRLHCAEITPVIYDLKAGEYAAR